MAARTRWVTALRARSATSPNWRGRPLRPSDEVSWSVMNSISRRAFSARGGIVVTLGLVHLLLQLGETPAVLPARPVVQDRLATRRPDNREPMLLGSSPGERPRRGDALTCGE